jgi:hypothetical protein
MIEGAAGGRSQLLSEMLDADEDLTARAVVRRSNGLFRHASDITRNQPRNSLLATYRRRQEAARALARKLDKDSKPRLIARLETLQRENAILKARQELLVASLRGVIHAVGEAGGMRAWRRFFPAYSAAFKELVAIGALPSAEIIRARDGHECLEDVQHEK